MASVTVQVDCPRCGGRGGWEGWPDFTCYLCRGSGKRTRTTAALKAAQKRAAAKVRTNHCVRGDHDATTDKWYGMSDGTWCGDCFRAFGKAKELANAEGLGRERDPWTLNVAIRRRSFTTEQELREAFERGKQS